jgi:alpha-D-ribose 1-methylphosphonate 5-triphosphate synthase subunit PhnG
MQPLEMLELLPGGPREGGAGFGAGGQACSGIQPKAQGRAGLLALPFEDSRTGTPFYVGEVLVYEVWLRFPKKGVEGYGMVLGEKPRLARALAYLDAALQAGIAVEKIQALALAAQKDLQEEDERLWRKVAATRLEVETL